ncbi:GatB/YqeY domain-containing protein [Lutibaculum baratangense]|uniref:GatB/YqeY domain-containing protein n=1 Tax=Lutibaculum baratangense TaxID=1358440 RepID=UPI0009DF2EAE
MREQINESLKDAVRSKDRRRMCTLRLINAAIKDRDIAARSTGRETVDDAEIQQILAKMVKQREESVQIYEQAGRMELAEQEREEMDIIRGFLPRQLSEDEVKAACERVVSDIGAEGLRDMGRTMSTLKERYPGQMDFGRASCVVKRMLN